jgi:L-tartrate/succinate antiporter
MIYPIVRHIPELYGSRPGESARRIGAYLMWTAFAATAVTSTMFATALAPNLLALQIVRQTAKLDLSLGAWILGVWPVGLLLLAMLPAIVYAIYPPGITRSTDIPVWAGGQLAVMGPITRQEVVMAGLVLISVALWIGGRQIVDATTVAFGAVSLMLLTRIVTWDDVVGHSAAWNVWTMIALLVTLADGMARVGFIAWFAHAAAERLGGYPPAIVAVGLVALFYFVHYLFASLTAHTTAVLPVVLAAGLTVPGMPVRTFALLLCYSIGLMGVLTPYATGPAPVYYGSGFVTRRAFWTLGFVCGAMFLAVLLAVGYPFLQMTSF